MIGGVADICWRSISAPLLAGERVPDLPMRGRSVGDDPSVISLAEFQRISVEVCASGLASDGDNLLGMEIDACAYLGDPLYADDDPGPWRDMTVQRSEGSEWLIRGHAPGKAQDASLIVEALSKIWEEKLRYSYRSAHTVATSSDSATMLAVTQIGPGALWVTARIEVSFT